MSLINKQYLYKIYDPAGNYITTWNDVINDPEFNTINNGGADVLTVQLARSSNNFGEDEDVAFDNRVKVWCFDGDAPNGVLIFSGYISEYTPTLRGKEEIVQVQIFSNFAELNRYMYETAGGATEIAHATVSPLDIFQDIFDVFTAAGGTPDYTGTSADDPGTVVSYTFNTNTVREAFDKVLELSPVGWYARIDPDDTVYYKPVSTTADHTFTIGKDVISVEPQKRVQSVVNRLYFIGGDPGGGKLYKKYSRSGSISSWGLYIDKYVDSRVTDEDTADIIAGRLLDALESPEIRTKIVVVDNNGADDGFGYDIESIKVGQTARVLGFTQEDYTRWDEAFWDVDVWDYSVTNITAIPQQIQKITYRADHVELELSNRLPDIAKRIEDINRNLVNSQTDDNPSSPTT